MVRKSTFLALPALALACLLGVSEPAHAQWGFGNRGLVGNGYFQNGYYYNGWGYPGLGLGFGIGSPYYWGGSYYSTPYYGGLPYTTPYYGGYSYRVPYYGGYYYGSPYNANITYNTTPPGSSSIVQASGTATYNASYPPGLAAPAPFDAQRAFVHVRVPAGAHVFFDKHPTTQTGTDRTFVTGPLQPDSNYSYTITARWMQNGHEEHATRTVRLIVGQTVDVDFTKATAVKHL